MISKASHVSACSTQRLWMIFYGCPPFRAKIRSRLFGKRTMLLITNDKDVARKSWMSTDFLTHEAASINMPGKLGQLRIHSRIAERVRPVPRILQTCQFIMSRLLRLCRSGSQSKTAAKCGAGCLGQVMLFMAALAGQQKSNRFERILT